MLILERRKGGAIRIGDSVRIEVQPYRGRSAVNLAINAPRDIAIAREELCASVGDFAPDLDPDSAEFRVTVVENHPGDAEIIRIALGHRGATEVNLSTTGAEAMRLLVTDQPRCRSKPHLILLDLRPSDVSHLEVLKTLRSGVQLESTTTRDNRVSTDTQGDAL